MQNKLRFIMPRLLGATAIAGLAALIITTLFKLLLGFTLLAGAVTLIVRSIGRRQKLLGQYQHDTMPDYGNRNAFGNGSVLGSPIQPVGSYAAQKGTSIVPIN